MNHHLTESMAYCHDKILFGITSALSGSILWIGAVFTDGEARWLYLTAASSIMMAGISISCLSPPEFSAPRLPFEVISGGEIRVVPQAGLDAWGRPILTT